MPLPTSGAISLNQMHTELGSTSGSQVSINDSDVRGLINKGAGSQMAFSEWYGASGQTVDVYSSYLNQGVFAAAYKSTSARVQWFAYDSGQSGTNTFDRYNWAKFNDFRDAPTYNQSDTSTTEDLAVWAMDNGEVWLRWISDLGVNNTNHAYAYRNVGPNPNFISLRIQMGGTNSYTNIIDNTYTASQYTVFDEYPNVYGSSDPILPSVILKFQARSNINSAVSSSASSIKNVRLTVTKS